MCGCFTVCCPEGQPRCGRRQGFILFFCHTVHPVLLNFSRAFTSVFFSQSVACHCHLQATCHADLHAQVVLRSGAHFSVPLEKSHRNGSGYNDGDNLEFPLIYKKKRGGLFENSGTLLLVTAGTTPGVTAFRLRTASLSGVNSGKGRSFPVPKYLFPLPHCFP